MPKPTPTSERSRAAAAALVAGELTQANPTPIPNIPAATTGGGDPGAKVERKRTESSMIVRPEKIGIRTPTRSESRPASGERTARDMAPGARTSPADSDGRPLTCETKSGIETKHEMLVSMVKNPISTAATNARFSKRSGDTNGWVALVMRHANRTAAR